MTLHYYSYLFLNILQQNFQVNVPVKMESSQIYLFVGVLGFIEVCWLILYKMRYLLQLKLGLYQIKFSATINDLHFL